MISLDVLTGILAWITIAGVVFSPLLIWLFCSWVSGKEEKETKNKPLHDAVVKGKHHPPRYPYREGGGWNNIMVCKCGSASLYEDNHPANPCRDCGTKSKRSECSGRWLGGYWKVHVET